jgi:hypothetical protein
VQWPVNLTDPSYDPMVLGAVANGQFEHTFVPITIEVGGHQGVFGVSQDALKIDGVRVNASATLQQQIADLLGAYLLTPKLLDQMWAQRAVTLLPCTQTINSTAAGMLKHSACVGAELAKAGGVPAGGIAQTVCKTWVLTNALLTHPGKACNMGWHLQNRLVGVPFDPAPSLPGAHMIQSPGFAHDVAHLDYSQCVLLIARACAVDGQPTDFASVAQNPDLAPLVSHEGVLKLLRQPGVPEFVAPPTTPTSAPAGGTTVALTAVGAGIGGAIAGPPGALVGGAIGWAADALRRRLTA